MSWLPHPSTWGKKNQNQKPPSLILRSGPGLIEILKSMGVNVKKEEGPTPLFKIGKVTPMPFPKRKTNLI
jgi:hypothetical protein